ncbi:MAG: glycosyltransferase family 2 protein [Schleiferiaceae bacterium]|nr:glycosyltransferase family 2 protein [Schleiferiaceae bacterium]
MKLSIVIVNYNVKHFLEQCLLSVRAATTNMEAEVFVVDNNSSDGSMAMVAAKFPEVITICNQENVGFSVANNQAMRMAKGEYILLLNPDTVVEESTFEEGIAFMDTHPDAGGLGAKMIDGKGVFLPESKRGLPTPSVAFYKIFGISKLFPHSPKFSRYHMGHLNSAAVHEIEILAGAFMLMRKTVLDKVGLLDEQFFMYGEDVDLSYRIVLGGYKNYYHPKVRIIHYKGESTKKGSINYVYVFYRAMVLFAKKHFSPRFAKAYSFLINIAIYLRASLSIFARVAKTIRLPALDFVMMYLGYTQIRLYWEANHRFVEGGAYPDTYNYIVVPIYLLIWILGIFAVGGYSKPLRINRLLLGLLAGTAFLLTTYALVPEVLRFSRALIVLGALFAALYLPLSRFLFGLLGWNGYQIIAGSDRKVAVVGSATDCDFVEQLLAKDSKPPTLLCRIAGPNQEKEDTPFVGDWTTLAQTIDYFNVREVIFTAGALRYSQILSAIETLREHRDLEFRIAHPDAGFLIGSNSIHSRGAAVSIDHLKINHAEHQRNKRIFDLFFCLLLPLMLPLLFIKRAQYVKLLKSWPAVMTGKKTWIGVGNHEEIKTKPCVIHAAKPSMRKDWVAKVERDYAENYDVNTDFQLVLRYFKQD